ncbi:glycerophosphodiester phosphodiesterase [Archangium sp.]|uniref:glycerophosphodiester phosphodiesterase n=1 Tax=Archangium sp. TaxID=1872627 RepID=UPI002ED844D0
MFLRLVLVATLALAGCGLVDAPGTPLLEAHSAGAGAWPAQSRSAVLASIRNRVQALEFDLLLTQDLVPVLSHDPWINEQLCTTADGQPVVGTTYIKDLTLAELHARFRCGGLRDPNTPTAQLVADTHYTFAELLEAVEEVPEMLVHIDLKYEPGMTHDVDTFAEVILDQWNRKGLPNRMYITSSVPEALQAFERRADVVTGLSWPRFPPHASTVPIALGNEVLTMLGIQEVVKAARDAGADGLALPYQLINRQAVEIAKREGLEVHVWTVNSKEQLEMFCRWPIDSIITDYPERVSCR